MADLAKTSKISVLFQCIMVLVVVIFCPVSESIQENGGLQQIASTSIIKSSTIFIGLGVLSFAFVCQHSAFIVAGSLDRPTKERWSTATTRALSLCVVLEAACGIVGYLAFLDDTEGKVIFVVKISIFISPMFVLVMHASQNNNYCGKFQSIFINVFMPPK